MRLIFSRNFTSGYNRCMNYIQDITDHPQKDEIERRVKVIYFFDKYGVDAMREAYGISRSTVYLWKKRLKDSGGKLSRLAAGNRAPKKRRKRKHNPLIESFLLDYRKSHPGVGKEAIKPALDHFCHEKGLNTISESTIGRLIKDLKGKGKIACHGVKVGMHGGSGKLIFRERKRVKKLRRKGYLPEKPGDLVQMDSITIFIDGIKRYLITAIDLVTKFTFSLAFNNLNSQNAKIFFKKFLYVTPFKIKRIQTDNGSEFEKYFKKFIRSQPIIHFHNYPRRPRSNAFIERFNRTIQEQYVQWNEDDLVDDINEFNRKLMKYLIWYNTEKPHRSINKFSPLRYYINMFVTNKNKSNMLWTLTNTCFLFAVLVISTGRM